MSHLKKKRKKKMGEHCC